MIFKRYYSYSNSDSEPLSELTPISILTLGGLNSKDTIKSYRDNKKKIKVVYYFKNTVNGKQYIGSAKEKIFILDLLNILRIKNLIVHYKQ